MTTFSMEALQAGMSADFNIKMFRSRSEVSF